MNPQAHTQPACESGKEVQRRKILIVGSLAESLVNFRGDLMRELVERGHEVVAVAPVGPGWVDEALRRWQVRRLVLPLERAGTHPGRDLVTLWALLRLMRTVRPDVVLAYTIKPVIYGLLAARCTGVTRTCALITGLGSSFVYARSTAQRVLQSFVQFLYRLALGAADVVLFQNPDDLADFRARRLIKHEQQVEIVAGSGVNLDRYARQPMPSGPRRFLLVARLLVEKGVREYIEAARRIRGAHESVSCHLIGPLEQHPSALSASEIEQAVRSGAIVYGGPVRDVRPQLAAAHIYVLPSYREGTPRTVLEAMSIGRPVITTDVPGCRETVVPGLNGALVPAADADALYREMSRFAELPIAELERMADESRRLAEAKFDVRKVNAGIIAALKLDT